MTTEPDLTTLTQAQLQGWNCALCGAPLTADRPLGTVAVARGTTLTTYQVWACTPTCVQSTPEPEPRPRTMRRNRRSLRR